ncbi:MAG TPA: cold shock domain-containing protein [Mycobacteriales bacterium]|nr:cold shock domain-containing protein [Mycobacteriales bacterium]
MKFFKPDRGWGAISSPDLPHGRDAWVGFSVIDMQGYRELVTGQQVRFTFEQAQQDSFDYRATWVRPVEE